MKRGQISQKPDISTDQTLEVPQHLALAHFH